jgi:feruloyl esterase
LKRPICAFPEYAKYKGSGDLKDAANWACAKP